MEEWRVEKSTGERPLVRIVEGSKVIVGWTMSVLEEAFDKIVYNHNFNPQTNTKGIMMNIDDYTQDDVLASADEYEEQRMALDRIEATCDWFNSLDQSREEMLKSEVNMLLTDGYIKEAKELEKELL